MKNPSAAAARSWLENKCSRVALSNSLAEGLTEAAHSSPAYELLTTSENSDPCLSCPGVYALPPQPPALGSFPLPTSPTPRSAAPRGAASRPPAPALCRGPGCSGSPPAPLGMLRGGRGGRLARRALALGGGPADARLQLELRRPELELPRVSSPLTAPSARAAAGAGAEAANLREPGSRLPGGPDWSGARSPKRGSPQGGASPAGTRALHWYDPGTSQAAR